MDIPCRLHMCGATCMSPGKHVLHYLLHSSRKDCCAWRGWATLQILTGTVWLQTELSWLHLFTCNSWGATLTKYILYNCIETTFVWTDTAKESDGWGVTRLVTTEPGLRHWWWLLLLLENINVDGHAAQAETGNSQISADTDSSQSCAVQTAVS